CQMSFYFGQSVNTKGVIGRVLPSHPLANVHDFETAHRQPVMNFVGKIISNDMSFSLSYRLSICNIRNLDIIIYANYLALPIPFRNRLTPDDVAPDLNCFHPWLRRSLQNSRAIPKIKCKCSVCLQMTLRRMKSGLKIAILDQVGHYVEQGDNRIVP